MFVFLIHKVLDISSAHRAADRNAHDLYISNTSVVDSRLGSFSRTSAASFAENEVCL